MKLFNCETCGKKVATRIEDRTEDLPVKGEPIEIQSRVRVCEECGRSIYDKVLDTESLRQAFDIYRRKHNILAPSQIKELREKYGLSQRGLAALLGWGEVTIHRYEQGSIPDEVHNQMLQLVDAPESMEKIFRQHKDRLPLYVQRRLEARLAQLTDSSVQTDRAGCFNSTEPKFKTGLLTGYKPFSVEGLTAMVLGFAVQGGGLFKTKLNKLLFYADFLHFKRQTVSISGATYAHLPYGPAPDQYQAYLGWLENEGVIEIQEVELQAGNTGERIIAREEPDWSVLPESAKCVLQAVYEHFKDMSSMEISDLSHEEDGYRETKLGEPISYEYADKLKVAIEVEET